MILSMTGYGKSSVKTGTRNITVEIKSLNSKSMDISTRIPFIFRSKELEIRSRITDRLERGKCDFFITVEDSAETSSQTINGAVFADYVRQIRDIANQEKINLPADWFSTLLRMPEVISQSHAEELTDELWDTVSDAVDQAISQLMEFREQEGRALENKFREKISNIRILLESIRPYEASRVENIRNRIQESLRTVETGYDRNRFEQELIFYIEKLDISEEKQRLENHLNYFVNTIETGHGQGKKLGFIAQEMGREINTLGSKSNQAEMQIIVVKMKDELEQIKEQVLNVM